MSPALKNMKISKYGDGGQFMSVANLCPEAVLCLHRTSHPLASLHVFLSKGQFTLGRKRKRKQEFPFQSSISHYNIFGILIYPIKNGRHFP